MKRVLTTTLGVAMAVIVIAALFQYSLYQAAMRIYDVDECRSVFVASILADGLAKDFQATISLHLLPFIWLARDATQSATLFATARIVSLLLFWLNLLLIALATGERLRSWRWLVAFFGVATLAPLWDFGFEVHQENLLLTGLLLTWCVVRIGGGGLTAYAFAGALAVVMQFTAFEAFLYTLPLTIVLLLFPPPVGRGEKRKLTLAWLGGALAMFVIISSTFAFAGVWKVYVAGLMPPTQWSPLVVWDGLRRLVIQTPLLVALSVAGLITLLTGWRRRGPAALSWAGDLPEAMMFLIALVALVLNPGSQPSNLVNLAAFAFLLAFRFGGTVFKQVWTEVTLRPVVVALLIFAHVVPFVTAVRRHKDLLNFRQVSLMELAERLTDPAKDRVFDGVGMVATRASIQYEWLLQSPERARLSNRSTGGVADSLQRRPAAVFIPNFRTEWLGPDEHKFIREHYLPLADDFWVLGRRLPAGGGSFEVIHPGRYQISPKEASCVLGTVETNPLGLVIPPEKTNCVGTLDGVALSGKAVELTTGTHRIETASDCEPVVVWVGPRLERLRPLGDRDHLRLFINQD